MSIWKLSNWKKACEYMRCNGLRHTWYAAWERVLMERSDAYRYQAPLETELSEQRKRGADFSVTFSILVPAYETKPEYLRAMITSLLEQSYGRFELLIGDAGSSDGVEKVVKSCKDPRVRYFKLEENRGIAENTNAVLEQAIGDYVGLLDHDDVLTPDALFTMAEYIERGRVGSCPPALLYSDEDKGDSSMCLFSEPHWKPDLNLDLLFSNNYICHFLVMERKLISRLKLRGAYDGAQDYDLVLRAVEQLVYEKGDRSRICHIPKVLYHWRCHDQSTAVNPASKSYAYEAGRAALEDLMMRRGWEGRVCHTLHKGFYRIQYRGGILAQRKEVGAIGGKLLDRKGNIAGGIYDRKGNCPYEGLPVTFSGYMHRAVLHQEAFALDPRCMRVRKELIPLFEEMFEIPYEKREYYASDEAACRKAAAAFGRSLRERGYLLVWLPEYEWEKEDRAWM